MKKIIFIAIFFMSVLFAANTALGKYAEQASSAAAAGSSMIDVAIAERPVYSTGHIKNESESSSAVSKTLRNLSPGKIEVLSYVIINQGSVDVLLEGVNIVFDDNELCSCIVIDWTVYLYEGDRLVKAVSDRVYGANSYKNQCLAEVSFAQIFLDSDSRSDDYCLLEIEIYLDETTSSPSSEIRQSTFTITPVFVQN